MVEMHAAGDLSFIPPDELLAVVRALFDESHLRSDLIASAFIEALEGAVVVPDA